MPKPRPSARPRKPSPRAKQSTPNSSFPTPAVIALRAHELFVQRGGEHGRDWEDWLTAERELSQHGQNGEGARRALA